MKRIFASVLIILMFLSSTVYAQVPGTEGGLSDGYEYKEYVFITGKPMLMTGALNVKSSNRGDSIRTTYRYTLTNSDNTAKLTRSYTVNTDVKENTQKHQTIETSNLDKNCRETIKADGNTYTLDDYAFSMSKVTDNKPAVDYFAGNWSGRKTYTVNKNQGRVTIDIEGKTTGYDHYWGSTETMDIGQAISYSKSATDNAKKVNWDGSLHEYLSSTNEKTLDYIANDPTWISFKGGYLLQGKNQGTARIDYDMPNVRINDDSYTVDNRNRNEDSISYAMIEPVTQQRMLIPEYRDTSGHWSEKDIGRLASLNVFAHDTMNFYPDILMTRADYVTSVSKAVDMLPDTTDKRYNRNTRSRRNKDKEVSPFDDLKTNSIYYPTIKNAYDKGFINGLSPRLFGPDEYIDRAQAVTLLVRAAGLEGLAPNYGYTTQYADDSRIPLWAKDSIYVASKMGIIQGDSRGRINPGDSLTRAEAAALVNRYIDYLKKDFQKDYKDGIINYK